MMLTENGRRVAIKRGLCAVDVAVALVLILLVILDCCSNVVGRSCNAGVVVCVIAPVDGDAVAWGGCTLLDRRDNRNRSLLHTAL